MTEIAVEAKETPAQLPQVRVAVLGAAKWEAFFYRPS